MVADFKSLPEEKENCCAFIKKELIISQESTSGSRNFMEANVRHECCNRIIEMDNLFTEFRNINVGLKINYF